MFIRGSFHERRISFKNITNIYQDENLHSQKKID